ncbi:MAG TPA: sugar phosphate isomerase/epimerase [Candidatus Acidoferrum sp.]|nr:sugar phosphate isomerase/epimerase [Candidatus Acidoferrum sp.]
MKRRTFIESSFAAVASASLPFRGLATAPQGDPIGMQLYTVRGMMGTDVPGTIAAVAKIGYKEVEFAGYPYLYSPKDLRAILDANGLSSPSVHVSYDVVQHRMPQAIEAAHVLGHKYIICPWIDDSQRASADGYKRAAELFNKAGEATQKAGIQFGYHNHFWEFLPDKNLGDKLPYDFLLESCAPANLTMELDLCWITVAQKDPIAYFKKYPGRFSEVHVKDLNKIPPIIPGKTSDEMIDNVAAGFTAIGGGVIDWKTLLPAAREAGVKHFFVENDKPKDAIVNLTESYAYLSKLHF